MLIREANKTDLQSILEIYNEAIVNSTAVYDYNPHTLEMRQQWYDDKLDKGIPVIVAEINDRVVGFTSYGPFRAWPAYKYSIEHSVYVHRDFRNLGVARKLLTQLIDTVKKKDVHTIIAGIDADNSASIHLHKQLGFEDAGHFNQVGYKFGKWLNLTFFQLILDNGLQPNEG
ncbi:MAG TPA: GNAT family N-acetyltransferase [Chryseolinea sp.]|nr:GNAT family N-acetyltransferase [Chryseolinea sp.]